MASPTILTRLVLLLSFLLGVFALEHAAPDPNTTKRQVTGFPRVYVADNNVWVAYSDNNVKQVTTTGTSENPFENVVYLSPTKKHAVVWQYTPAEDHKITLIESSPKDQVQPKRLDLPYLKAGDRVRVDRPRLFDVDAGTEIPTNNTLFENPFSMKNVGWSADGQEYRFLFNGRGHQHQRLIGMQVNSNIRAIVDESSETFIDWGQKLWFQLLPDTQELLWASERDGWNHIYLYNLVNGTVKNRVTQGNWLVRTVHRVDTVSRRIWFSALGIFPAPRDPYYSYLVRINFDGTGLVILTPENGTHNIRFLDNTSFQDTWSRVDQQETKVVRSSERVEIIMTVKAPDPTNPLSSIVETFAAPGRDGTTPIHGIIVKPTNFDPSKKYPILEEIYAGPQEFSTPKAYSDLAGFRAWADLGYIVVKLDGMGTNWRSKAFLDVCHKNLADAGFPDRKAWIKAAASTRPWMDLARVGIMGSSAGGQNAVAALLFHNDFYKAAVADSGCHDNRMNLGEWSEAWMGWPVGKQYEDSSNVVNAAKLQGSLLLMTGDLDRNVDPSSTFQLVHALNEAGKDYEFVFVPGGGHGVGDYPNARRMTEKFLKRSLA